MTFGQLLLVNSSFTYNEADNQVWGWFGAAALHPLLPIRFRSATLFAHCVFLLPLP